MRENPWFEQSADKDMKKSNFHFEIHKNSNHERWLPLLFGYSVTGAKHAEINTDRWIFVRGAAGWRWWAACVTAVGSVPWQHSGAGCQTQAAPICWQKPTSVPPQPCLWLRSSLPCRPQELQEGRLLWRLPLAALKPMEPPIHFLPPASRREQLASPVCCWCLCNSCRVREVLCMKAVYSWPL